jgi:hypothetical protein
MTGDDHEKRSALLTSRDIAALNRAREVLRRVEDTAWRRSLEQYDPFAQVTAWDLGRLSGAATAAEDALFQVLSTARANCGVRMTDTQLRGGERAREHERTGPETVAEPAPVDPPAPDAHPSVPDERVPVARARGPMRVV